MATKPAPKRIPKGTLWNETRIKIFKRLQEKSDS